MGEKCDRLKNNINRFASRFWFEYKYYLLVFFIIYLVGFLTGIFTCTSYIKDVSIDNLINKYLYNFIANNTTFFSYFLTLSVYFVIIFLFTFLCVKNKFMTIVNVVLLALMSYIFGFDILKQNLVAF